jgi:hypothetical protein
MSEKTWELVKGAGQAYSGPCLLTDVVFWPDSAADYVDIYDGRDTKSGEKFCRVEAAVAVTWHMNFGDGIPFSVGIYLDGKDSAVETTVAFIPL